VIRDVVELEEQFQRLESSRFALSAEMRATATRLRDMGEVPTENLDRSFDDYREMFDRFRAQLGITSHEPDSETESTWDMFHSRLSVCRDAEEATVRLRSVDRLSVFSGFEATLESVRQASRETIDRLATSPWNEMDLIQEVREGQHPLCRLVSLVERLDVLSDDEWTTEMAAVQQSFGVPLSTAIARGKVSLSDSERTN
jgi:hypothetical protein